MEFDPLLSPSRLRILAALVPRETATFAELKAATSLKDGNLHVHVAKLSAAGYVEGKRIRHGRREATSFWITDSGLRALRLHVQKLQELLASRSGIHEPRRPRRVDDSQVWLR